MHLTQNLKAIPSNLLHSSVWSSRDQCLDTLPRGFYPLDAIGRFGAL